MHPGLAHRPLPGGPLARPLGAGGGADGGDVPVHLTVPGRLELLAGEPPTLVDVAHNPDGARALAEALPDVAGDRPAIAVIAVLAAALAPALDRAVCTELPAAQRPSTPASALLAACEAAGLPAEAEPDFPAAVARARTLAAQAGAAVLVTGSHYVLGPARAALS